LLIADSDQQTVLVATENGFGKRTALADFRHSGRGTQGVIAIAASERNGKVVAARLVSDDDEIMLITTGGVLIRTRVREIRELGRATQGVTLIALDAGEKLAGLEKVVESEEDGGSELDESSELTELANWTRAAVSRRSRIQALNPSRILLLIPNRSEVHDPLA
jgi:DNA gyrase subunit A